MKELIQPPKLPGDRNSFTVWMDHLIRWCKSNHIQIQGWRCVQTVDGKLFIPPPIPTSINKVPFCGNGAPSSSTLLAGRYVTKPTPSLYVDLTGLNLYVCTTAGTNSTSVWMKVGGGGGDDILMAITTLSNADYFMAVPITVGTSSGSLQISFGSAVKVAKLNRMRTSIVSPITELVDGVTITYSNFTSDNLRTATDGTNTEYQVAYPRYTTATILGLSTSSPLTGSAAYTFLLSQCVIKATPLVSPVDDTTTWPAYEEITPRVWARQYSQSGSI